MSAPNLCSECRAADIHCPTCAIRSLTWGVLRIAYGDTSGPTGLEALGMSLAGQGTPGAHSLADAITTAIADLAEAIREGREL